MARPSKSLEERIREKSFLGRRHYELLAGPLVSAKRLRAIQAAYQAASSDPERRAIALDFEREISTTVETPAPVEALSPADFFERYFVHTKGALAGQPFVLEPWQRAFVNEFYRRDEDGRRIYRFGILGVPRGNGKSPLAAALALRELVSQPDSPDVFVAAAAKEQARIVFNFARSFAESGDLADVLRIGRNEIVYPERLGSMRLLSADGALQHGHSPSAVIVDELHAFQTEKQRELFDALQTALHKRLDSFMLAITTAGFDTQSLLGKLYEEALAQLELEQHDGLTIGRDEESGVLFWWYAAPETAALDDEQSWRVANPASWIEMSELRRQRLSPALSEASFRRLHLNQWTSAEDVWITPERWAACLSSDEIPEDSDVYVGIDAAWVGDATAVAVAWRRPDGKVLVRAHVWSAIARTPAHVHVSGGYTNFDAVEDYVLGLARRYRVFEVRFDPAFFARSAQNLSDQGLTVAPVAAHSIHAREAYSRFYEAVNAGTLAHNGDPVLTAHVLNAAAHVDLDGHWKVRKLNQRSKIDALVACVMAHDAAQANAMAGGIVY
jgi:phage terminase large subunit-like protein